MNISKEEISPVELRLTVAIAENDYKDDVTKKLKEIGRTHVIPGFRKGHVPFGELKRRFGKQLTSDVINDTVYRAVIDYITENKLNVMGHPMPVEVKEAFEEGDQEFKYDLALIPTLDIKPSADDHYPFYEIEVTDEMIDEQDTNMRKRFGSQKPGEEMTADAVVKGSLMQLNENGEVNTNEGAIQVTDGILAPFLFKSKAEAEKFEGTKVGDKVVFNPFDTCDGNEAEISSMLHIDRDKVESARGNFEINIAEFIVNKPAELGEEYYKKVFGEDKVHNEEEYRKAVAELIARALQPNSNQLFTRNAEDYLMETYGAGMALPVAFLRKFMLRTDSE
ncbi:trigger factor family protein, partial [uncultured Duncaniella sp.]|uniref:trigger factor family protein n=1 Tax=uncultured Duncaniella sp. TaxID=2768039 RepID=UPI002658430B